jgi:hypothetical protein
LAVLRASRLRLFVLLPQSIKADTGIDNCRNRADRPVVQIEHAGPEETARTEIPK